MFCKVQGFGVSVQAIVGVMNGSLEVYKMSIKSTLQGFELARVLCCGCQERGLWHLEVYNGTFFWNAPNPQR